MAAALAISCKQAAKTYWQEHWGDDADAFALLQHEDGTSKGCGIVEFSSVADARRAISMLSNTVSTRTFTQGISSIFSS